MSSSRWCRCLRSALNGDLPARRRRSTARPKSSSGTMSTANGSRIGMNAGRSWLRLPIDARVDLPRDGDRRDRHEQPDQEGARVAHEELRRVPVERQEPDAVAPISTAVMSEARLK